MYVCVWGGGGVCDVNTYCGQVCACAYMRACVSACLRVCASACKFVLCFCIFMYVWVCVLCIYLYM